MILQKGQISKQPKWPPKVQGFFYEAKSLDISLSCYSEGYSSDEDDSFQGLHECELAQQLMYESRTSPILRYQSLWGMKDVELKFQPEALEVIANQVSTEWSNSWKRHLWHRFLCFSIGYTSRSRSGRSRDNFREALPHDQVRHPRHGRSFRRDYRGRSLGERGCYLSQKAPEEKEPNGQGVGVDTGGVQSVLYVQVDGFWHAGLWTVGSLTRPSFWPFQEMKTKIRDTLLPVCYQLHNINPFWRYFITPSRDDWAQYFCQTPQL